MLPVEKQIAWEYHRTTRQICRRYCGFPVQLNIQSDGNWRELYYKINVSTPSVLRFFGVIRHKRFHNKHAFTEKAQHLRRWISLWMLTRGRLVPHQPRAIKRTTRTELRDETIVRVAWLKIKGEMVCGISSCKIRGNTAWNDAFYTVICI